MFKNKLLYTLILAGLGSVPAIAMADGSAAPVAPAAPTLSSILDASGITATGYVDVGYTNLNSTGAFVGGAPSRVFDAPNPTAGKNLDSFNLNQAAITVSKAPKEGFGGVINLTAGQDANVIASYGAGNSTATTSAYNNHHDVDVTQAYASYAGGPLTVIAGKFTSLAGAEVIASPSNTNYSRSILFGYAVPFTHTGVRATYAATDTVSLIAGVNNGWDQVSDMNSDKTVELGFTAAPNKMFSLAGVYYGGKELAGGVPAALASSQTTNGNRQLFDLVATLNATDQLTFILNYDNGSQDNASTIDADGASTAKWDGLAAYVNYQFSDKWRTSLRSEYMNDKDGYKLPTALGATAGQRWSESTLTLAYIPAPSFEVRGEVRGDSSNQAVFLNSNGTPKSNQTSFGLEALYKF
jgi:hypothetical protein